MLMMCLFLDRVACFQHTYKCFCAELLNSRGRQAGARQRGGNADYNPSPATGQPVSLGERHPSLATLVHNSRLPHS